MRILFISHSAQRGGAEAALIELVAGLQARDVACLVLLPKHGVLENDLKKEGIDYKITGYSWWMSPRKDISPVKIVKSIAKAIRNLLALPNILRVVNKWQPDVIYTNTITIPVGALSAKILGRPHIWHIHEFGGDEHGLYYDWGQNFSYKTMSALTDLFIVVSEAVREKYVQHFPSDKIKMVYQSVTLRPGDKRVYKKEDEILLSLVGNISRGKDQLTAVKAVSELAKKGKRAQLLLAGEVVDEAYAKEIRDFAERSGIKDLVKFAGWLENPDEVIKQSDILLVCTHLEAFGRVAVEGMLAGTVVLGADSGATAELIKDGYNGLLFEKGNFKEASEKIEYLLKNTETKESIEKSAYQWAKDRFTRERYSHEIFNLLETFIKK